MKPPIMPPLRGFYYLLTIRSFLFFEQTLRNRRFRTPISMVTSLVGGTKTFTTPEVLKKTSLTSTFLNILQPLPGLHRCLPLIPRMLPGTLELKASGFILSLIYIVSLQVISTLKLCIKIQSNKEK